MQGLVIVTGGSKGIGLAITEKFLSQGYKVITISRTEGDAAELKKKYGEMLIQKFADLTSKTDIQNLANSLLTDFPQIDILVNNAGTFIPGQIQEEEDGVFELMMSLNLAAAYHTTRALLPAMYNRNAYIFNICSTASIMPYINGGSYCISKHALLGFSRVLRKELTGKGVSVSAILPGATKTESWDGTDLPDSRFIKPSSIAVTIFLAWSNRDNCVLEEILIRPVLGDI